MPLIIFILICLFLYLSSSVVVDYFKETQTMSLNLEDQIYPPHITICRSGPDVGNQRVHFMKWLHNRHPCSRKSSDYIDSVRTCLKSTESDTFMINLAEYSDEDWLPTAKLTSRQKSLVLEMSAWKKLFHPTFGVCYNLDSKYWSK